MEIKINKDNILKTLVIYISIILTFFIIIITDNIMVHVFSFLTLSLISIITVKFDFYHPFTWYIPFFAMYSIAHPVLLLIGGNRINTYSKELMILQLVGLTTFLIVITPKRVDGDKIKSILVKIDDLIYINKYIYFSLYILLVGSSVYISQLGHEGKNELFALGNPVVFLTFRLILLFLVIYVIGLIKRSLNDSKKFNYVAISLIPVVLLFLFSGERDLILRFILLTFYVLYTFDVIIKKNSNKKYLFFSLVSLLVLPLLATLKYIGLGRGVNEKFFDDFLVGFFRSDFIAASTNLQILIDNNMDSYFSGYTFYTNLIRSIDIFGFKLAGDFSSGKWFNEYFYSHRDTGMGFTLVGDGYINFGVFGVFLLFLFISFIIRVLYHKSSKNVIYYLIYLFAIPIYIYSIRGDLSTLLSPLITQIILTILFIKLLNYIVSRGAKRL
ncbi:O-antigen polymerase [Virgibacillus flavescens]|uniref:O-antigen polymerase n=1 Tax=Virgibacillus flavescens TaxID=1611422 RepID=UPI003D34BF15